MRFIYLVLSIAVVTLTGCSGMPAKKTELSDYSEPLKVQFAGFAYIGDERSIRKNFKHSVDVNTVTTDGVSLTDDALKKTLKNITPRYLQLEYGLADLDQGESVTLALVMDRELVNIEKISDSYRVRVELGFQALVFDFDSMSVIGAYPITLQYIDVTPKSPEPSDIKAIIKGALTGNFEKGNYSKNIPKEFARLLSDLKINQSPTNHLQITSVTIEDNARGQLPDYLQDMANARNFVAQNFVKFLSKNQQVSVLPFTRGNAIGNRMSGRFANGDVFNLTVPEADYGIDVVLRGFKKVPHKENNYSESFIYGAYFNLKVFEPLGGTTYMDSQFVRAKTEVFPKDKQQTEDWPIFENRVLTFFNSLTKELSDPGRKWAKLHRGDAQTVKELNQFKKIVESCR